MSTYDDNHNEMEEAPLLSSLKKRDVFQAPEGYFDQFPDQIKEKREQKDELGLLPHLLGEKKKTVFHTPEGYFESFPTRIKANIQQESEIVPSAKRSRLFRKKAFYMAVAAAITLLLISAWWWTNIPQSGLDSQLATETPTQEVIFPEDIPLDELMAMIDIEDYSLEMIMEAMDDEVLEKLPKSFEADFSEEEINHLLEDIDISDLEEDFLGL